MAIPDGYVGMVYERSSLHRLGISLQNKVGVIDSDYRGEILLPIYSSDEIVLEAGTRIAQIIIQQLPKVNFYKVLALSDTKRGCGSFGSSGKS